MLSISSLVLKATGLMLLASTIVRGCDRTCDTLYFADVSSRSNLPYPTFSSTIN